MNLYVSTYGSKIGIRGGKLTVESSVGSHDYPLDKIDKVALYPGVSISQPAIKELTSNNKCIFWLTGAGKIYASIVNPTQSDIIRQKSQFDLIGNKNFAVAIARRLIKAKISKEVETVCDLAQKYDISIDDVTLNRLDNLITQVDVSKSIEEIEGCEGFAAKLYYSLLKAFIPAEFNFVNRTKHPPRDCFSSVISYLYTLLYNDLTASIQLAGLNPSIGIMHKLKDTHFALSSDLMEEFRAECCDAIAIDLIRSGEITLADFDFKDDGTVFVKYTSQKKLISAYENNMNSLASERVKSGFNSSFRGLISQRVYEYIEEMAS